MKTKTLHFLNFIFYKSQGLLQPKFIQTSFSKLAFLYRALAIKHYWWENPECKLSEVL